MRPIEVIFSDEQIIPSSYEIIIADESMYLKLLNGDNKDVSVKRIGDLWNKKVYGITGEEYNKMLTEQDNCCKICLRHASTFSKGLYVDHCHSTGKVRGLLCVTCNNFLGAINDNPDRSDFIKEYLS